MHAGTAHLPTPSVNIATYQGDWTELADFIQRVWGRAYAGRMTFPHWTSDYLEWQLGGDDNRDNLLEARIDDKLVGVLLGANRHHRTPSGPVNASQWSWLSVDQDFQGLRIAKQLDEERLRRQVARHSQLIVSYRYVGSKHSRAEKPHQQNPLRQFHCKLGFWARIIDPDRFAAWHYNVWEGRLARWGRGLSPRIGVPPTATVRAFHADDLDQCGELLRSTYASASLSVAWDRESLRRQLLESPLSQTLVLLDSETIVGVINYHVLEFNARTVEKVAVVDILAFAPQMKCRRTDLIQAALVRMRQDGVILALKLRCGDVAAWPMLRAGFLPQPADSFLVLHWTKEPINIRRSGPLHLLWR